MSGMTLTPLKGPSTLTMSALPARRSAAADSYASSVGFEIRRDTPAY